MNVNHASYHPSVLLAGFVLLLPMARELPAGEPVRHRILMVEYNPAGKHRLLEVSPDGQLDWQHDTPGLCVQFERLPNGHILYGYGGKSTGAQEIDRDGKVIWSYRSHCPEALCFDRLENGNTLIVETTPLQVVTVNSAGQVVETLPLTTTDTNFHSQVRRIQRLENGNTLAALSGEGVAREFRPDGSVAWDWGHARWLFQALRLPDGNTLISCGTDNRLVDVDAAGKIVWELKPDDIPEVGMIWPTSVEVLPNGNLLVANFLHGRKEPGAHCFEVTRQKDVVWQFADRSLVNAIVQVSIIDDK